MVQRVSLNPKPQPRFIEPMECRRVAKLSEGEDSFYEIKQDGYRRSRSSREVPRCSTPCRARTTVRSSARSCSLCKLCAREISCLMGRLWPWRKWALEFSSTENRRTSRRPIVYYVFDVFHEKGRDTLDFPLEERENARWHWGTFRGSAPREPQFRTELSPLIQEVKSIGLEV